MIAEALAEADRPNAVDPNALADHLFVTFEGAFILCRSTDEPEHMRAQLRVLRELASALVAN